MNHYQTLGVPRNADEATIRKAFRALASKLHPDRKGGDAEQMARVNAAYEVLSDPERRERYDTTGNDKAALSVSARAEQAVMLLIQGFLDGDSDYPGDLIGHFKAQVTNNTQQVEHGKSTLERKLGKLKRRRGRLTGADFIDRMIDVKIELLIEQGKKLDEALEINAEVMKLLTELKDTNADGVMRAIEGYENRRVQLVSGNWSA